jgi:hypothetical protein
MDIQGENTRLKQFLLGCLAAPEIEEIGLQIISDESFEEKMTFAEEDLIEDFLEGSLSTEEKQLFYANFINCPARIELLEETALLKKYAKNNLVKPTYEVSEEKKSDSFLQTLKKFFALNLRPIAAVCLILVIAAVAWRVFLYDSKGNLTQTEKEYAALNAKDLSNAPEIAGLSNKSLIPGTLRDTNSATKLTSTNLTESVLFRLALPAETSKETFYNIELSKDGKTVFRQPNIRVYQNQNGQEVKILLPKTVLPKGSYQLKLTNSTNKDSIINYSFVVE